MVGDSTIGLLFRIKGDSSDGEAKLRKFNRTVDTEMTAAENKFSSAASNISDKVSNLGQNITALGMQLTGAASIPLIALGALGNKAALSLDDVRTKITALVGDSDKANKKMAELRELANQSVGLTQSAIFESYAQLKGIGGITDETINKIIQSLGKLNAAFKIEDLAGFNQNLNQIFNQGFERADIKEAIGRVPFFEQLLEQAFSTSDGAKLKKLKESGKLTLDGFLSGMSEAIDTDDRISNIQDNLTVKLTKGWERVNFALAPIGDVLLRTIIPVFEMLPPYIEMLSNYFTALSPTIQTMIVAVGGIAAAIGPVLIGIGAMVGFLAPLISGIGSFIGGLAAFGGILASVGGFITSFIGLIGSAGLTAAFSGLATATVGVVLPALGAFVLAAGKVILAVAAIGTVVLGIAAVVGAGVAALYTAWKINFGGIQTYTFAAWEAIKTAVSTAMNFIYGIVQQVGGAIVGWWRENYPLIRQIVQTASDAVRGYIQSFLDAVRSFWESHGAAIMDYVRTYWNVVSGIISSVITQIGNYIKLGMQLIQGNWSGAWQTFQTILQNAARILAQIWSGLLQVFWKALKAIVPIVFEYGSKISTTLLTWVGKAVVGVGYIFATLPYQLLKLIPNLYRAGLDIANAIWQGIKAGITGNALSNPITIPTPNTSDIISNNIPTAEFVQSQTQIPQTQTPTFSGGGGSGGNNEAEKRRKEREELAKREAQAQIQILQNQLQDIERLYDDATKNLREKFAETGNIADFQAGRIEAYRAYSEEVKIILSQLENLENAQAAKEKKTASELELLRSEQSKRRNEIERKSADRIKENDAILLEAKKKQSEKETALTVEQLKNNLALREAANAKIHAENEKLLALGLISEEEVSRRKRNLDTEYLDYRLKNLEAQRKAVAGNADEEARYNQEILLLKEEIARKEIEFETAEITDRKKRREDEKKAAEELLALRSQILETEREILDFRAEQEKKRLANAIENSSGKARLEALIKLRDFELIEAHRKQKQQIEDLEKEEAEAKKRVEGKENEEAQKKAIEDLYREARILAEEEFQARLKEIRDGFNPQIEDAEQRSTLFGSIVQDLKELFNLGGQLPTLANIFANFADMVKSAFAGVASAIGQVVQNWILYGETGPAVMRKILASALATIAAEAAVRAVFELAAGFAALFFDPAEAAAHFTAAAIYGSIAGVAALAGRAVAGNAFKQQTGAATNGNTQNSSSGQNRFAAAEEALRVIAEDRANPSRNELILKVQSNDSHILEVLETDINNNGKSRGMFIKLVEAV